MLSSMLYDDLERCDGEVGKEAQDGGDICLLIADSCCCRGETNNL